MDNEKIITLEEYENENGCIDSYEAAAVIKLLCLVLYKLHKDKITYRELCPGNILLVYGNGKHEGKGKIYRSKTCRKCSTKEIQGRSNRGYSINGY